MNPGTYGGVEAGFTLDNYKQSMNVDTLKVYLDSFLIAIETTIICLLIAYPFAYFVAQKTIIKKTIFMTNRINYICPSKSLILRVMIYPSPIAGNKNTQEGFDE